MGSPRNLILCAIGALLLIVLLIVTQAALAADARFCGAPERNANGTIKRSAAVRAAFMREYPCPGRDPEGRCTWIVDHVVPLACGGCDMVENMQWLPRDLWLRKSAWERKVYGGRGIGKGCP